MHSLRKHKKRKKGQEPEPPPPMSLKAKLQMWAWIAGMVASTSIIFQCSHTWQERNHLDKVIDRWKRDYHLTEEQARRVRALEERFHGTGNPFTQPTHTPAETREHHALIAAEMSPEEGARFFRAQEGRDHEYLFYHTNHKQHDE